MAVDYEIQAEVIDINSDNPTGGDAFVVDTNVWYWMTYTRASQNLERPPSLHQINDYPAYMNKAIKARAGLYRCEVSFSELADLIERTEFDIFRPSYPSIDNLKTFRHNCPDQRDDVVKETRTAWGLVKSMARSLEITIDEAGNDAALNRMGSFCIDSCDLFIYQTMFNKQVLQIITDDGDFATVPGIKVFTANRNVIDTARTKGKLITR